MMLQVRGAVPTTPWELIMASSAATWAVLIVLLLFSLLSWFLIVLKWSQFRRVRKQGNRFFNELERTTRLEEAYHAVMKLPPSPYGRLTQLEALRMVLAKEVGAERDAMARFIPWLATIGSVSPLMGLLGTVLGVMDAFIGIAIGGSGNISAVAPGVAEALTTTVLGLAVAIPAIFAYNIFASRLGLFAGEMEGFAHEIIGTMAREGRV
ncbi:MAG: MotA/TolQ/ExbB proton channel family protein [Gemmatimonadetes bacterium]|nr:MotA/TolQ/ExbB proton channel family protein [Gemmatimonadota bacterium]